MNPDFEPVGRDNQKWWAILSGLAATLAVGGVLWLMGSQRPEVSAAQTARNAPIPGDRVPPRSYTIDLDQAPAAAPADQAPEVEIESVREKGAGTPDTHRSVPQPAGPPIARTEVPPITSEPPTEPPIEDDKPTPASDVRPAAEPKPAPPPPVARIETPHAELHSEASAPRPAAQPVRHEPDRSPKRMAERPRPAPVVRRAGASGQRAMAEWHRKFLDDP